MSLWILLGAHLIADFYLQTATCAEKKTQKIHYLVGHGLIYAVVLAIASFGCIPGDVAWLPFVIIAASHFFIDWIRIWTDQKSTSSGVHFASFIIDQVLHISIICTLVYILDLNTQNRSWLSELALTVTVEQILQYVLVFIIILNPTSVFVKKLSIYVSSNTNHEPQKEELSAGSIIGKLERIIIVILVFCNEISTIGFVLAAKSLARHPQLNEPDFAEKYLIGTLSSTSIAIIVALLLKG